MLTSNQIADAKGYLFLGHKQHDIAAHFGVNSGRIAEIATGKLGSEIIATATSRLAPIGSKPSKSPRYFTPSQSLDEQIEIFEDLIATVHDVSRPYLVTPQLAAWILQNKNRGNRKVSSVKVSELTEDIEDNHFFVTGATIVFGKSGRVLDGQHRLLACARSGRPIKVYLVFNIDDAVFSLIDTGRKRSNMDAFHIAGVQKPETAARATRWLLIFSEDPENRDTYSNQKLLEYYKSNVNEKNLSRCIDLAEQIEKAAKSHKAKIPTGPMAALLYLFYQKSVRDAEGFARSFIDNKSHGKTAFNYIRKAIEMNNGRIHEVSRNAAIVKAWNAYRKKLTVTAASLRWNEAGGEEYPEIV